MPLESADDSIWQVHDKQWMVQRKEEWRKVKYALNIMTEGNDPREFKKKYHRYHQNLFFYGQKVMDGETLFVSWDVYEPRRHNIERARFLGGDPFFRLLPLFDVWYHPRPDLLDLDEIRSEWLKHWPLPAMWKYAQKLLFVMGKNRKSFDPTYGAMGGREKLIVELCCPDVDYKKPFSRHGLEEEVLSKKLERSEDYLQPCPRPKELVHRCLHDTCGELKDMEITIPYKAGQYLWDHLSFAVEHYPEEAMGREGPSGLPWVDNKDKRRAILVTLHWVLNFKDRTGYVRKRPSAVSMVDRLMGQYERKEFSPTLMKLWEEARDIELTEKERNCYERIITGNGD